MEGNEITDRRSPAPYEEQNKDKQYPIEGKSLTKTNGADEERSDEHGDHVKDVCDLCENGTAVATCVDCEESLCVQCKISHERSKASRSHKIVPMDSVSGSKVGRSGNEPTLDDLQCSVHEDKNVSNFCKQCKLFCCKQCMADHQQHDTISIETSLPILQLLCLENAKSLHQPVKCLRDSGTLIENKCSKLSALQSKMLDKLESRRTNLKLLISEKSSVCRSQVNELIGEDISQSRAIQSDVVSALQKGESLLKQMGSLSFSSDVFSIVMGLRDYARELSTIAQTQDDVQRKLSQHKKYSFEADDELDAWNDILGRLERLFKVKVEDDTSTLPNIVVEYFTETAPNKNLTAPAVMPRTRSLSSLQDVKDTPDSPTSQIPVIREADPGWVKVNIEYVNITLTKIQSRKINFDKMLGHKTFDKQLATIRSVRNNPHKGEISLYDMKMTQNGASIYPYASKSVALATSFDILAVGENKYVILEEEFITLRDMELGIISMTDRTKLGFYVECMAVFDNNQIVTFDRASFGSTRISFLSSKSLATNKTINIPDCDKMAPAFNPVFHLFTTANGDVLVLMRLGTVTFLVVRKDGTVQRYTNESFLNKFIACCAFTLCVDDLGTLWMGTDRGEIVRMNLDGVSKVVGRVVGPILGMALGGNGSKLFVSHFSVQDSGSLLTEFTIRYSRQLLK